MSGHSKWASIKHKKGAVDAKRGKAFTKLIKELTVAARMGGADPNFNPRLRTAIAAAKAANMPKDNIDRAVKKGTGDLDGVHYEEVVYEGYGPGGTAIYVEVLTDNRNRTVGELRHVLTKYGGSLGSSGCVSYLFTKKGVLTFDRQGLDVDALLEAALDAGAEDASETDAGVEVTTAPADFEAVKEALVARGLTPAQAELSMIPSTTVKLEGKDAETMLRVADALEDLDDVQNVHANFDISEEEMAKIAS